MTELFFDAVVDFDLTIEVQGEIVDNHLEDNPDLESEVSIIRDFIAGGAKPEVVLSRLAVRKSEAAHLAANMIRRQASLPPSPCVILFSPALLIENSLPHFADRKRST